MTPLIGLVSGTYNRLDLLQRMVETFRADVPVGMSHTITLIDGGSTDGTLEWARAQSDVQLIEDGKLTGAISAFTRGAYATQARYIIMSNDDVEFVPGSILRAFVHLEDHPGCGAVAFADNRPIPGLYSTNDFKVLSAPATKNGVITYVPYAQVGMFRKWLGDAVDWWGANTAMKDARTYAGDNNLSAHIWKMGYTVEAVAGCAVIDRVADDELRQINGAHGRITNNNDSDFYYDQWPGEVKGPMIPPSPVMEQQDIPSIRVLYLPIYEPGWTIQKTEKHGLRDALANAVTPRGWKVAVHEIDYLAIPPDKLEAALIKAVDEFQPRLILTQIQAPGPLTGDILAKLRSHQPRASIINWNGDYWPDGLVSADMLKLLRQVDLQLTVNGSVLEQYRAQGITADYWQIGYEEPGDNLPEMPKHDILFLGNKYWEVREKLWDVATSFADHDCHVGFYGSGWLAPDGFTLYNFAEGKALYRNARIALGDNQFPDAAGYVSNRLFQAMAAGGCLYLQQRVKDMEKLIGLKAGAHYIEWIDHDDLRDKLAYWLDPAHEDERRRIAEAGTAQVRKFHNFDARVNEFFSLIRRHMQPHRDIEANAVRLRYIGPLNEGFGEMGHSTGLHYQYEPGREFIVDKLDAPYFLARRVWEVET